MNVLKKRLVAGITVLVVVIATILLFVSFAPHVAHYNYWVAMIDLAVLELLAGGFWFFNIIASTSQLKSKFPLAMQISIGFTLSGFLLVSILIDAIFATSTTNTSEKVFLWITIFKWVILCVIIASMWLAGKEGEQDESAITISQKFKTDFSKKIDVVLSDIKQTNVNKENENLLNDTRDSVEILRNKARGLNSARSIGNLDLNQMQIKIETLLNATKSLSINDITSQKQGLVNIQGLAKELIGQLDSL